MHGPRRAGFCACEIVANAYRSRLILCLSLSIARARFSSRQPPVTSPFRALFLCARLPLLCPVYARERTESVREKIAEGQARSSSSPLLSLSLSPFIPAARTSLRFPIFSLNVFAITPYLYNRYLTLRNYFSTERHERRACPTIGATYSTY